MLKDADSFFQWWNASSLQGQRPFLRGSHIRKIPPFNFLLPSLRLFLPTKGCKTLLLPPLKLWDETHNDRTARFLLV